MGGHTKFPKKRLYHGVSNRGITMTEIGKEGNNGFSPGSGEERVLKLNYMQLIVTETHGSTVKTVHSEVGGKSLEQCFEYTKKLHNGEVK